MITATSCGVGRACLLMGQEDFRLTSADLGMLNRIGSRGISVIFASGDGGVRGNHDDDSVCNDRKPATPDYQAAAVATFINGIPSGFNGTFNTTGRGYPDVSLLGWNFNIIAEGELFAESGTSASAPSFAAIIALINDQLVAAGKHVLGHNSGFECPAFSVAFDATPGWDALSGVGTPIFPALLSAALA
ncbi:peptidase S8/S53 domain-containing protein [Mycena alexandri]|uniref:Peptidase S8/S53 domain-containing protein n=1 Tax=Mycena alexandri TaxID=1745969 RepID=A0AAD6TDY5_9AGAR|nr:peptidase S8/S53 domain-containing protein [Mycena alexandri]